MKTWITILLLSAVTFLGGNVIAQDKESDEEVPRDLQGNITGKWKLTDLAANKPAGVWDFQTDGNFRSTGHFLSTESGSFRTDENRSVVFIQVGEDITEWKASITEKGIILKQIIEGKKTKPAHFQLTKVDVN
jgi:hypothetical protein